MHSSKARPKVILIQPILAHYRRSFIEFLLRSPEAEISVIAGHGLLPVKTFSPKPGSRISLLQNRSFRLGNHRFYWQSGLFASVWKQQPDILILPGIDFHFLSSLLLSLWIRFFTSTRLIWWGHATIEKQGKAGTWLRNFFFRLGNGIISYNKEGSAAIQRFFPEKKVMPLFNSLNLEDYGFEELHEKNPNPDCIRILFSGRLSHNKRLDVLLEALAILKNRHQCFSCRIIGDGPALENARMKAGAAGITDSVEFCGPVYGAEANALFCRSDLFVLPGKVGLSVVHALSFGLPVLTSGKLEIHSPEYELIEDGKNGGFFEDFNAASLAGLILTWKEKLIAEPELYRNHCRNSVREGSYLPDAMAKRMADFALKVFEHETRN